MRSPRRRRPQFEVMESREVLSTGMMGMPMIPAPLPIVSHQVALSGSVSGVFFAKSPGADVGKEFVLAGTGRLAPIGFSALSADLHSTGFIANGHAEGQVTLKAVGGSLTLQLVGPTQGGFAALPSMFSYTITGGTGKFHGATGTGVVKLVLSHETSVGMFTIGRFTMTFSPNTTPMM